MIATERELNIPQSNGFPHADTLTKKLVELLTQAVNYHRDGQLQKV